uniref:Uncharacterized protein n=1 Tax=Rhizophora mucronata TaxID=61149 RepID=A0A2P2Q786_RHIMU
MMSDGVNILFLLSHKHFFYWCFIKCRNDQYLFERRPRKGNKAHEYPRS